jgi:hypothetical protein
LARRVSSPPKACFAGHPITMSDSAFTKETSTDDSVQLSTSGLPRLQCADTSQYLKKWRKRCVILRFEGSRSNICPEILEQLDNSPAVSTDIFPHLINATLGAISEGMTRHVGLTVNNDIPSKHFSELPSRIWAKSSWKPASKPCKMSIWPKTEVQLRCLSSELSASRFKTKALVDALGDWLPIGFWRAATYLPTTTFRTIRRGSYLANQIGRQIVRERLDAARQGLEMNDDLFSLMCEYQISMDWTSLTPACSESRCG